MAIDTTIRFFNLKSKFWNNKIKYKISNPIPIN